MKIILIAFLLIYTDILPQMQKFTVNNYLITIDSVNFTAQNESGQTILEMSFSNPSAYVIDLDGDLSDELLIIDSLAEEGYRLNIFNTLDTFYLAENINSGSVEPYYTVSEELDENILVTGNADFVYFDKNKEGFLPLNCWKYESGELLEINDEIYDVFIAENETIIAFIDDHFNTNIKNCVSSENLKGAIAAVYTNYINAGEHSLASQFLKNYYLCTDIDHFKDEMDQLLLDQEY